MTVEFTDIVGLINAIAWPIVAVIALVAMRKPLMRLFQEIGGRITKVSAFDVSVELTKVPEFEPSWSGPNMSDVRQLTPADEFSSAAMALFEQLESDKASDFAIIDLGTGQQWLTSRLFIFAILLERMRGLRCFVFVERQGNIRRRFVGTATPREVRWAIARRYAWLEAAYAKAYSELPGHKVRSFHGSIDSWNAMQLVGNYLREIQRDSKPDSDEREWACLQAQRLWEHARWVSGGGIKRLLGGHLKESWLLDSPDVSTEETTGAILRREGQFVALVDEAREFKRLVDRQDIIENAAHHMGQKLISARK
jgi:hypothetical protein